MKRICGSVMGPGEERRLMIGIRVNRKERDTIDEKSASAGLARSEFMRRCALGAKIFEIPRPETRELLQLLKRISGEAENLYLALISTGHAPEAEILRDMSASCGGAVKAVLDSFRPVSPV